MNLDIILASLIGLIAFIILVVGIKIYLKWKAGIIDVNYRNKVRFNLFPEITNGHQEGYELKGTKETETDYIINFLPIDTETEGVQPEPIEIVIPKENRLSIPGTKGYNHIFYISSEPHRYTEAMLNNPFIKSLFDIAGYRDKNKFVTQGFIERQEENRKAFTYLAKGLSSEQIEEAIRRAYYVEEKRLELKNLGDKKK